ncbi:hypothetical protein LOZ35_004696 [Ophidiomyces ophidiicola]|nr:hypothetical protein LOZ56_002573 [Ophidiomyces ophidiicola]KAI2047586.1 hypothetical protein LOZ38_004792 [Ophidiomyces ophidiicola]KAI2092118.1 hypothetical protein LOZ35_004696 [Ophidiomyces ophidiicola]KAI2126032.1 hypothetical protein LOZ31_003477 [Ophidiomyces ophidiicola]KAI2154666.1 hypothetical protein LOZ26_004768 [Ophidiomyces ophidiicola]
MDPEYGMSILHEPDCNDIIFDLVAVHGLNGDAFKTWTHKQSKVMWLRDLLPKELPNVRIMTFGYNSKFYNFTGHQDLRNISLKLLSELVDVRSAEKEINRPIVFVCHSLGGIVALLIHCNKEQMAVQNSTYAIMFLATPHNGSALANSGNVLANIVDACTPFRPARTLLSVLRKDSKALFEITEDFIKRDLNLRIVSFFEMEMTRFGIFRLLVVEQRSAILNVPCEISIGQFADHRDIARFSSVADRNYRPVLTRLLRFTQDLAKMRTCPTDNSKDLNFIFEIPLDRCISFRGREALLSEMEMFFNQPCHDQPLIYALTGLGGSGKTNSALQYALRNRFKYKSGVVYFNSSSAMTLIADFHRIHDLLCLGNSPDQVTFVKQWFAKPNNRNWLMIFDGADDLRSIPLASYFPVCAWGHIIVTSKDQAAIGLVAPAGRVIDVLEERDAIGLLFEKAAIGKPSADDLKQASMIVHSLGCLPLAVDQAGAFIRRRQKTLRDYYRLFRTKQYEVLSIAPGIDLNEKAVATVWEQNFCQLEKDSPEASRLLILFSFLEPGNISEFLLRRGCSVKRNWNSNGEIGEHNPTDAGLDPELVGLLNDEMSLDYAIQQLLTFSFIQRNDTETKGRVFSIHSLVQKCAVHRTPHPLRLKWLAQAVLLVSHAFPVSFSVDDNFDRTGFEMFVHVPHILEVFDELPPSAKQYPEVKQAVCTLLLSASLFNYMPWKRECIFRLKDLLQNEHDCYLKALAARLESRTLRREGKIADSYKVVEKYISGGEWTELGNDIDLNPRWNATKGGLLLTFCENLMRDGELSQAQEVLSSWTPLNPQCPSTMENLILRSREVMMGRAFRNQGHFKVALQRYEKLLHEVSPNVSYASATWQMNLISNTADLYCEVGKPNEAERVLETYARQWQEKGTGRRLMFTMIESFIRRGMFKRAEPYLLDLIPFFEAIIEPDIIQSTAHARVWIGLARIYHLQGEWNEALMQWQEALQIVESKMKKTGFTYGVILYSIAQVQFQLGRLQESLASLERAEESLAFEERKYWIVGLGTYWYDYVVTTLGKTGPSPVVA